MGLNVFNIFLLFASFAGFVISEGFITDASRRIGNLPEINTNQDIKSAHKYSILAAVIGWISVALLLVAGILIVIFGEEVYASGFTDYLVIGLLFFTLAGAAFVGIMSAITASDLNKSGVQNNNGAYRQAIIATLIAIFAFVAILIAFFIKLFYKPKKKTDSDLSQLEKDLLIERVGGPEPDMT